MKWQRRRGAPAALWVLTCVRRAPCVAAGASFLRFLRGLDRQCVGVDVGRVSSPKLPAASSWGPLPARSLGTGPSLPRPAVVALGPSPRSLDGTAHSTEPRSPQPGFWQLYYKFITC